MISINLKAKHYYLIADILFSQAAYVSFSTLEKIKIACNGLQDEDIATVEIDINTFIDVFSVLAQKPEGSYNNINTEMMDMLIPQIQSGVSQQDPEWIQLADTIQSIRSSNLEVVTNSINSGKNKLYN